MFPQEGSHIREDPEFPERRVRGGASPGGEEGGNVEDGGNQDILHCQDTQTRKFIII